MIIDPHIALSAASLLLATTTFFAGAWINTRKDRRETESAEQGRIRDQIEQVCSIHQADLLDRTRAADARIHARIDDLSSKLADQLMELTAQVRETSAKVDRVGHAVNGGLEERLTRAVRAALRRGDE